MQAPSWSCAPLYKINIYCSPCRQANTLWGMGRYEVLPCRVFSHSFFHDFLIQNTVTISDQRSHTPIPCDLFGLTPCALLSKTPLFPWHIASLVSFIDSHFCLFVSCTAGLIKRGGYFFIVQTWASLRLALGSGLCVMEVTLHTSYHPGPQVPSNTLLCPLKAGLRPDNEAPPFLWRRESEWRRPRHLREYQHQNHQKHEAIWTTHLSGAQRWQQPHWRAQKTRRRITWLSPAQATSVSHSHGFQPHHEWFARQPQQTTDTIRPFGVLERPQMYIGNHRYLSV